MFESKRTPDRKRKITKKGVLSPTTDIDYRRFMEELVRRDVGVKETMQPLQ